MIGAIRVRLRHEHPTGTQGKSGKDTECSDRPCPCDQHIRTCFDAGALNGVDGHCRRLDQGTLLQGERVWDGSELIGRNDGELSECSPGVTETVSRHPNAQVSVTAQARANTGRQDDRGIAATRSPGLIDEPMPDGNNGSRELHAQDLRQYGTGQGVRLCRRDNRAAKVLVEVGPANPCPGRLYQDLARTGFSRSSNVLHSNVARAVEPSCPHGDSPFVGAASAAERRATAEASSVRTQLISRVT